MSCASCVRVLGIMAWERDYARTYVRTRMRDRGNFDTNLRRRAMQGSSMSSGLRRGRPTTADTKRRGCSFHDLVLSAVKTLGENKAGVSRQKVVKHVSEQFSVRVHIERKVILALRRLLSSGKIVKAGASGSFFKISPPAKTKVLP